MSKLIRALGIVRSEGWARFVQRVRLWIEFEREKRRYQKWLRLHGTVNEQDRLTIRASIDQMTGRPLISVVVPVYNVDEEWLRLCLDSVLDQLYENWELCVADDHSTSPHIHPLLEDYAQRDGRIKVTYRAENGHISAASNSALELATGEFVVLLDHDDELAEDALYWVANELDAFPKCDMIYSDWDKVDERGRRFDPAFKPDWSQDLFYSLNFAAHLSAFRTELVRRIGGFRQGCEGSQDYDLTLRLIEQIPADHIRHIPRILYHWRAIKGSVALSGNEKPYAHERAREALRSHFERLGTKASIDPTAFDLHRISYDLPVGLPQIALVVHGNYDKRPLDKAAKHLLHSTHYEKIQVMPVPFSHRSDAREYNRASKLNQAVREAECDVICFVEAGLSPVSGDWLKELVSFVLQPDIGVAGAKLLNKDRVVLHAGYILGTHQTISNAHAGLPFDAAGNLFRNVVISDFSAVSISCMMVRRKLFDELNGLDENNLPGQLFDADLCLRLGEQGYRVVVLPDTMLIKEARARRLHFENSLSGAEQEYFKKRWGKILENDPFYNPNLSKKDGRFSIDD